MTAADYRQIDADPFPLSRPAGIPELVAAERARQAQPCLGYAPGEIDAMEAEDRSWWRTASDRHRYGLAASTQGVQPSHTHTLMVDAEANFDGRVIR